MNKNMISWSIFFAILVFGRSDFAVIAPENDDLAVKFYNNTASQSTHNFSFLLNYTLERNWYCVINNRIRLVAVTKRKFINRRIQYYANCHSSFNPTISSQYLIMCGDIHPNPGPTTTNTNTNSCRSYKQDTNGPRNNQSDLYCVHMNARSLKKNIHLQGNLYTSNLLKFQEMIYSETLDIMFVSETWLNSDISSKEVIPHGYDIYRTDRSLGRNGGGVLVAIKQGVFINCSQVTSISTANLEAVAIQCTLPNHEKWLLVCCYRPPISKDMSDLRSMADNLFPNYDKIIIAGDFNLPNISWTDYNHTSIGTLSQNFCDILDDYFMSQLCLIPTRESNILDLIITNQPEQISILDICDPTELGMKTDHKATRFTISKASNNILSNKRLVYDYKRGNFDDLRKRLIDMDICSLMTNNGTDSSIDDDWSIWKNGVLTAVHESIPTKHVNPKHSPPWITPTILHQIREKVITRKRYLSRGTVYLKEKFSRLRAQVKKAIKESRESFFQSLGSTLKINPKRFWSIFKIKSSSGSVPSSVSRNCTNNPESRAQASTPHNIASMFNEYFHSVYTIVLEQPPPTQPSSSSSLSSISSIDLTQEEVCYALLNLDPSKAHGPDGLPSRILKECAQQLAPSLHYLFTKSLKISQVPAEWKLANIIPIHKKGNKNYVENYRPISLLSIVSKTLERCVLNHIYHHIQSNIHSAQFGFVRGRSCATQLLSILNTIGKNLDKGLRTDIVFMDIAKAFDTVDHSNLLRKLREFGFSGSVLLWFQNYLSGRSQRVTVHGATSQSLPITSGVPQGSLLSPFLFSIYINDLPNHLSSSTGVGLFADDTKLYKSVQNPSDALVLQEDIQSLQSWSEENRLRFNNSKCKVLSITRESSPLITSYSLDGQQLALSYVEIDLGVVMNSNLTWTNQVNSVRSKANKMLGLIRRSTMEMHDIAARKYLYLQLVRNNFAYASQVWSPQTVKLIEDIEKVQRRATKYILNLGFITNVQYTTRLFQLDLLPLTYWHEYLDLVLLYKIINGYTYIDDSARPIIAGSGITRSQTNENIYKFSIPFASTVTFQTSYFIRACKTWNILGCDLRHRDIGLNTFKSKLKSYYKHALSKIYNCDDPRTWKSICVKCRRARSLDGVLRCC